MEGSWMGEDDEGTVAVRAGVEGPRAEVVRGDAVKAPRWSGSRRRRTEKSEGAGRHAGGTGVVDKGEASTKRASRSLWAGKGTQTRDPGIFLLRQQCGAASEGHTPSVSCCPCVGSGWLGGACHEAWAPALLGGGTGRRLSQPPRYQCCP